MQKDDRNEVIRRLKEYAAKLAEEYGYTVMQVGEDRQKGIWGEEFTKWLEQKNGGDCATQIYWYQEGNDKNYVEFRFWFSSPCVSVSCDNRQTFCEVCVSDKTMYDENDKVVTNEDGSWKKDGIYRPRSINTWGAGCLDLANRMVKDIEAITHPMNNEFIE